MNTFLPYPDFKESARVLDYRRLGKQRVETIQLLECSFKINRGEIVKGWANHPARLMWANHLDALCNYGIVMCTEWINRGYRDTLLDRFHQYNVRQGYDLPEWVGDERLHSSHRSNLLRKDPMWYGKFGWLESNDMPYFWPTKEIKDNG